MTDPRVTDPLALDPPPGLRTRGTVLVVPGRGESTGTYRRFGTRLAVDAYQVRVLSAPTLDQADLRGSLDRLGARLSAAVTALDGPAPALAAANAPAGGGTGAAASAPTGGGVPAGGGASACRGAGAAGEGLVRPLVLVGADSGAAALAALAATVPPGARWWPDALVLAGLPGHGARVIGDWDSELDARTHCPVHRGALRDDPAVRPGALAEAVPDALLDAAYGSTAELPQLLLVGDADPLADRAALARLAKGLPAARLAVVRGGHRDVLNDLQHRSVAAEIVSFLEVLRGGLPLVPTITVEASSW
ncbi:alpha/beta hydrolase [Frankia sp. AgB32]|uniref:alpha/beta hydrolase n=1 Tax=Frankia sp. AgB32 TaxID=631119 RepID=UPI00200EA177|nr:alpha/beta hydrolase [Frankia sp. AgB32]MCK9895939.1 alpha/beta hydrolase [Frankia sp. AgB32]